MPRAVQGSGVLIHSAETPDSVCSATGTVTGPLAQRPPAIGFILVGGALVGAQVRDIRLANELARRGYPVHVWWAFDKPRQVDLDPAISQQWLFSSARYSSYTGSWLLNEEVGRTVTRLLPDALRARLTQRIPDFIGVQMRALIRVACRGIDRDRRLVRRFARELSARGITHLLPTLEILALFAQHARPLVTHLLRYLVTFQGYEVYANYARQMGCEAELYRRLAQVVDDSDWPAVAVSEAYCQRIGREVGIAPQRLAAIPPGIPMERPVDSADAARLIRGACPNYRDKVPLLAYVGRRDSEKGLDLLLYAAKILERRGVPFQLAICGPTAFGRDYQQACAQIASHLRLPVLWNDYVSDALRGALFRMSRAVIYPSIHEEPFGMVPVEAMAQGTPALVPDTGGVASVVQVGPRQGGLQFRSWDTSDLADKLQILIEDQALHARLSTNAPLVASHFSVENLGERLLDHLDLARWNQVAAPSAKSLRAA
ncbi:MAG: glycosyltransferase family 4 protein [Planctomycetales bacterium]